MTDREYLHPLQELFKPEYPGDETHPSVRRDERHADIYEILHGKEVEDGNSCQRVED